MDGYRQHPSVTLLPEQARIFGSRGAAVDRTTCHTNQAQRARRHRRRRQGRGAMGWPRIRKERQALQSALLLGDAVGGWQGARGRRLPRHRADLAALELIEPTRLVQTKGVAPAMLRVFAFGCPY